MALQLTRNGAISIWQFTTMLRCACVRACVRVWVSNMFVLSPPTGARADWATEVYGHGGLLEFWNVGVWVHHRIPPFLTNLATCPLVPSPPPCLEIHPPNHKHTEKLWLYATLHYSLHSCSLFLKITRNNKLTLANICLAITLITRCYYCWRCHAVYSRWRMLTLSAG